MTQDAQSVTQELKPCPFCGATDHLHVSTCGSMTSDMPDRPHRVVCDHIDHDQVQGPVDYGRFAAIAAWNTRLASQPTSAEGAAAWLYETHLGQAFVSTFRRAHWDGFPLTGETPLYARPTPDTQTAAIGAEVLRARGQFLVDRIEQLDWSMDLDDLARDWRATGAGMLTRRCHASRLPSLNQ